jgi:hypothetical protein
MRRVSHKGDYVKRPKQARKHSAIATIPNRGLAKV